MTGRDYSLQHLIEGSCVCGTCGGLFETRIQGGLTPAYCACHTSRKGPTWERYDYNANLELCACCKLEALPSGSRFSVWFCKDCKERALDLNTRVGKCVIPIGRHSLMAGIGIRGGPHLEDDAFLDAAVERFATQAVGWLQATSLVYEFGPHQTLRLARLTDMPIRTGGRLELTRWFSLLSEAARTRPDACGKRASFDALVSWFGERAEVK